MWTHPAPSLHLCWKPLSLTPFTHLSHHWSSSVLSLSAPLFRTPHGKSPVWINPTRSPLNLSPLRAAGPGKKSSKNYSTHCVRQAIVEEFRHCISHCIIVLCTVVHREPRRLWRAAGFLSLSSSGTQRCATSTPSARPPLRNCIYADSTPSPLGIPLISY